LQFLKKEEGVQCSILNHIPLITALVIQPRHDKEGPERTPVIRKEGGDRPYWKGWQEEIMKKRATRDSFLLRESSGREKLGRTVKIPWEDGLDRESRPMGGERVGRKNTALIPNVPRKKGRKKQDAGIKR